jgi:bacillithiol system protein YtxJ
MEWNKLESVDQLDLIDAESKEQDVLIFKHSTRCSISSAALARLERSWNASVPAKVYYLDLLEFRPVSNAIAARYGVEHQSPQALLIRNGACIYHESHMGISVEDMQHAQSSHSK